MQVAQIFFYHCFQHHCGKELSIQPHLPFLCSASHFVGICVLSFGTIPIFTVTVYDCSHGLLKGIYSNKCLYLEKKNISGTRGESGSKVVKNNEINIRVEISEMEQVYFLNINKILFVLSFRKNNQGREPFSMLEQREMKFK